MGKVALALDFSKLRTKSGYRKRSNVNSNYQFPNGYYDDDEVLPALHDYLATPVSRGALAASNAPEDDVLQVFDDYAPTRRNQGRSNGHLAALSSAEQRVVQLDEYPRNGMEQRHDTYEFVRPLPPRPVAGE